MVKEAPGTNLPKITWLTSEIEYIVLPYKSEKTISPSNTTPNIPTERKRRILRRCDPTNFFELELFSSIIGLAPSFFLLSRPTKERLLTLL